MTTTYFRRSSFWIVTLLSVLSTLLIQVDATAQPSGARGDDFIYRVVQNDTLINLSSRFTGTDSNWQLLQSLNQVADPYALQIGREIRIPFALIPEIEADGVITHRVGPTLINGR